MLTLKISNEKWLHSLETCCWRRLLRVTWMKKIRNEGVLAIVEQSVTLFKRPWYVNRSCGALVQGQYWKRLNPRKNRRQQEEDSTYDGLRK